MLSNTHSRFLVVFQN